MALPFFSSSIAGSASLSCIRSRKPRRVATARMPQAPAILQQLFGRRLAGSEAMIAPQLLLAEVNSAMPGDDHQSFEQRGCGGASIPGRSQISRDTHEPKHQLAACKTARGLAVD